MRFSITALLLIIGSLSLKAVELVKNGKAVSDIIISKTAPPSVKTAANELQRHLKKISGAKLRILNVPGAKTANHIYVGQSEFTKKLGLKLDDVKHDGFKIIADGNHVIVAGKEIDNYSKLLGVMKNTGRGRQKEWENFTGKKWRRPTFHDFRDFNKDCGFDTMDGTGTLYGVYALLEQLGWMWVMPVPDIGIVYPELENVSIKKQSIKCEPEFGIREYRDGGKGMFTQEFLWHKSMRIGNSFTMPVYHAIGRLTHFKGFQDIQPKEYFGVVNGEVNYYSPKLSSPKLRDDFLEYLGLEEKAYPGLQYSSLGQPDGWAVIDDKDAAAGWDKEAEMGPWGRFSDYYWDFILNIRERFMKTHSNRKFTVYAYGSTTKVPTSIDKVPENVIVAFCQRSPNWGMPAAKKELEYRDAWIKKMGGKRQLFIHDYYLQHAERYNFPPVPIIYTKNMKLNFDGLYDHAIGGLAETGWASPEERNRTKRLTPKIGISHLMLLLHARLCWDRNLDIPAFIDDYCGKFFGPAKDEMKEFYAFSEKVWMRPDSRLVTASGGFLKKADVRKYFEILARAKAKAGDSVYGKRIDFITAEMEPLKKLHDKLKRKGAKIRCFKASGKPTIDGDIDTPFWRKRTYTFHSLKDMITGEKPKHLSTNVSFRWLPDNSALIVAIECIEPKMSKIKKGCAKRDSMDIFSDDNVEIHLETNNGIRPKIVINPNGAVFDSCQTTKVEDLPLFYTIKEVGTKKYSDRWTVELRIDAKTISGNRPSPYFPWGVNICRQRLAGNTPEYYMLSPSGTKFNDNSSMANLQMRK